MRDSGRITAAIDVLQAIEQRRTPVKTALRDWGQAHRFAGSKDRAWISGLVMDALRRRRSLSHRIGVAGPRARVLAALRWSWGWEVEAIAEAAAEEPHGTGPLYDDERAGLTEGAPLADAPLVVQADAPDWLEPHLERAFGERAGAEGAALTARAGVDLRLNALKTDAERAFKALASIHPERTPYLDNAARIPAAPGEARGASVETIPAYGKGWVEVQDLGSQIAAACAGDLMGAQVLDFCAGGGGKTLALAALMANTGQLYAYDIDARRLSAVIPRAKRAGVRNLQIRSPVDPNPLSGLEGKMDVVFVDAPCTGSGVWRRHPDAKWRVRPQALESRMAEQDQVLREAAAFVKPGGRLVYVTCSWLVEENEDRVATFLEAHPDFARQPALDGLAASGAAPDAGLEALSPCQADTGALRLSPLTAGTDGFFVQVMGRG